MKLCFKLLLAVTIIVGGCRPDGAEIVEHGLYEFAKTGHKRETDFGFNETVDIVESYTLLERTERVVNVPGTTFAIEYVITGPLNLGDAEISVRLMYPEIDGRTKSQWTFRNPLGELTYAGQTLGGSRREEGTWTFQIVHDGRVLAEQSFEVVMAR